MAKKKLTPEEESQIKTLLANNEMLEKTKREAKEKGKKIDQIVRAQQEVVDHINSIDPTALENKQKYAPKKENTMSDLFGDTDMSMFDFLDMGEPEVEKTSIEPVETKALDVPKENEFNLKPDETVISSDATFGEFDSDIQYDVIQLPSNGQCYKSKVDRLPVAYLTAYDENIITSPNLYKDGLVIDFLLKNKIVNKAIDVDDLVSGDVDAITLFLRATSYGADFPIVVTDPETGEQIDTTIDLTTLKPKDFKLIGDENGYFDFETPVRKDKIKFRYLTRKQEKQLKKVTELENNGAKAFTIELNRSFILNAVETDKLLTDTEAKTIKSALNIMGNWVKKLKNTSDTAFTNIMTNTMLLHIVSVNGNTDRNFIKKYVKSMPARDSLMLRRYINDNRPGINFEIEVQRPESLGGGSFKTFLNWDDSIFLNLSDV